MRAGFAMLWIPARLGPAPWKLPHRECRLYQNSSFPIPVSSLVSRSLIWLTHAFLTSSLLSRSGKISRWRGWMDCVRGKEGKKPGTFSVGHLISI